jgi:hypothetical protein
MADLGHTIESRASRLNVLGRSSRASRLNWPARLHASRQRAGTPAV